MTGKYFAPEAWRNDGTTTQPAWLSEALRSGLAWFSGGVQPHYTIQTREGEARADWGDWIIHNDGELRPCSAEIFQRALTELGLRLH